MEQLINVKLLLSGIGVFLLGQGITLIWHLSKITAVLTYVRRDIEHIVENIEGMEKRYFENLANLSDKIEEHAQEIGKNRSRIDVIENRCEWILKTPKNRHES